MKKFIITKEFWDVFPDAKIGVVIAKNINNQYEDMSVYQELLHKNAKLGTRYLPNEEFSSNEVIDVWRKAYQKFKTKKGARCSIEALLKRVKNGNMVGNINPLVDVYNAISLKYALPCGGEDMDHFVGDVYLTKANGDEEFITLGSQESEPPYPQEIIYKDDYGAICRCWNWRESMRTILTEDTKKAFLIMESVDLKRFEELNMAIHELADLVSDYLHGKCKVYILDKDHPEICMEE